MCPPGRPSTSTVAVASGRIVAGCWRACARGPAGAERARVAAHGAAARSAIAMGAARRPAPALCDRDGRARARRRLARGPASAMEPAPRRAGDRDSTRETQDVNDLMAEFERVRRTAGEDGDAKLVELRRGDPAAAEEGWGALTDAERIARWVLPISGDRGPGGRFQLEGNAGGDIRECDPPRRLLVTWEFGGQASILSVDLAPSEEGTEVALRHAVAEDDHWAKFGPGAVGVGWDLGLLGLALHLETGEKAVEDADAFIRSPDGLEFMRASAQAWGDAHVATGGAGAKEAAERTRAAYTPNA